MRGGEDAVRDEYLLPFTRSDLHPAFQIPSSEHRVEVYSRCMLRLPEDARRQGMVHTIWWPNPGDME